MKLATMAAHPAELAGGVSDHKREVGHGFGNDGTGTDECIVTDVVAADHGGIGTDGGTAAHTGAGILASAVDTAAGIGNVSENHRGTEENVVTASNAGIDGDVVLNLHVVAKRDAAGYEDILTEIAAFTENTIGHDMAEMPNVSTFTNLAAFVDNCRFVSEI